MNTFDVVEILGYGVIGFAFLLAFLAYRLLTKEQKRENPRPQVIRTVYSFMVFSVVLCGFGLASEFMEQRRSMTDWINQALYYTEFFQEYENDFSNLADKAKELLSTPQSKEQELLNIEIEGLVTSIRAERQRAELFKMELNGELEKVARVLQTGDAQSINRAILTLNETLPRKGKRLREKLRRIPQPNQSAGTIQVISATYGKTCGVKEGNVTAHLASNCNGMLSCAYIIDHQVIGDPALGCAKNYIAEWRCGTDPTAHRSEVSPEAGYRKTVNLSCQ